MAEFVFNIAKGRVAELYNRVKTNDPANSALVVVAVNRGAATDATMKDYDTLSAVIADANVAEVTNTGYARKVLTDADLVALTPDDTNDKMVCDAGDLTFNAVAAGTNWTDLLFCYDPDSTTGDDTTIIPLTCHPLSVTPDGSNITVTVSNFYSAS